MTDRLKQRTVAFIRSLASHCPCVYRSEERCRDCCFKVAKSLLLDIERDEMPVQKIDYSCYTRMNIILATLKAAGHPLLAKEIPLQGLCSMQLKYWTLSQMVKRGLIGKKFAYKNNDRKFFKYYLKHNKETK